MIVKLIVKQFDKKEYVHYYKSTTHQFTGPSIGIIAAVSVEEDP